MRTSEHYSPVDYYTLGWSYPRSRLREPFLKRQRRLFTGLIPIPVPPPVSTGTGITVSGMACSPGAISGQANQLFVTAAQVTTGVGAGQVSN